MKLTLPTLAIIFFATLFFTGSARGAVVLGQIDDFEDGTTQLWTNGGAFGVPPVVNVPSGGPAGMDDNFMQITSIGGGGPGRFLVAYNRDQWIGNYISAGVISIEMDLMNQGSVDLSIRLAFKETATFEAPGYLSAAALLAPGSGWQHFVFTIDIGSMIAVGGPAAFNTFFSGGMEEMRIINEVGIADLNGDVAVAQLGVDNIRAVPEPTTFLLGAFGLIVLAGAFRRERNSR